MSVGRAHVPSLLSATKDTKRSRQSAAWTRGLTTTSRHPDLSLLALGTGRDQFLWFINHPGHGTLLRQPELRQHVYRPTS